MKTLMNSLEELKDLRSFFPDVEENFRTAKIDLSINGQVNGRIRLVQALEGTYYCPPETLNLTVEDYLDGWNAFVDSYVRIGKTQNIDDYGVAKKNLFFSQDCDGTTKISLEYMILPMRKSDT